MDLKMLLKPLQLKNLEGEVSGKVKGLACDSRKVKPGALFFALSGPHEEGWRFAPEAIRRGAAAAVVEESCPLQGYPLVRVPAVRPALALLASRFYGYPSENLRLIGVTGTNGKTTTAHLIDALFRSRGEITGLLGTVSHRLGDETRAAAATTPEAHELQEMLAELSVAGAAHVSMEVSSHALDQERVLGCRFDAVVLTNITSEHLDYHKNTAAYLQAKAKLFAHRDWGGDEKKGPPVAVLNVDSRGYRYIRRWTGGQCITYGIKNAADLQARELQCSAEGISFRVLSPAGSARFKLALRGRFNIYNALAAIAVGLAEGFTLKEMAPVFESFPGVRGRFEPVEAGQDYHVIVDYAHTPDGLVGALEAAREITPGRVILVFGCGGERDRSKRPLMGEAAGRHSDLVFLTDDNPRDEDPLQIVEEALPGLKRCRPPGGYQVIPRRREAIAAALQAAQKGDLVLIAGKGHENEQLYRGRKIAFSDREVAAELIRARLKERERVHLH